jgi:hypothetical protein
MCSRVEMKWSATPRGSRVDCECCREAQCVLGTGSRGLDWERKQDENYHGEDIGVKLET